MGNAIEIRDVEDLRKFNKDLHEFTQELSDSARRIDGHCHRLGESWRDQEYAKFLDEWTQSVRAIERFIEKTNEFSRHLAIKSQRAQDFLDAR
jgi:hypothetical protein